MRMGRAAAALRALGPAQPAAPLATAPVDGVGCQWQPNLHTSGN